MACYFVGFEVTKDSDGKKKLFAEGRDAGLASLKLNPGSAPANFWTGVNMALYGQTVGILKMLFTLPTVRGYLYNSAKIDPSYAYGGAYRILGKIEQELPGILGGSYDRARQYYEKAIIAAPDEPMNYLFMADLALKTGRDRLNALDFAYKGLALPVPDESRHESHWAIAKLKEFIRVNSYPK
jgi:tetratricopeptide (TPR) repeat protein